MLAQSQMCRSVPPKDLKAPLPDAFERHVFPIGCTNFPSDRDLSHCHTATRAPPGHVHKYNGWFEAPIFPACHKRNWQTERSTQRVKPQKALRLCRECVWQFDPIRHKNDHTYSFSRHLVQPRRTADQLPHAVLLIAGRQLPHGNRGQVSPLEPQEGISFALTLSSPRRLLYRYQMPIRPTCCQRSLAHPLESFGYRPTTDGLVLVHATG